MRKTKCLTGRIFRWVAKFGRDQQQLKDAAHTGLPATSSISYKKDAPINSDAISQVNKLVVGTSSWYFKEAFTI